MTAQKPNWSDYKVSQYKAGDVQKGIISEVLEGEVRDFVKKGIEKWKDPEARCLQLKISAEDGSFSSMLMMLPQEGNMITPNSALGKHKTMYGKFPEAGDEVKMIMTSEGYWEIVK